MACIELRDDDVTPDSASAPTVEKFRGKPSAAKLRPTGDDMASEFASESQLKGLRRSTRVAHKGKSRTILAGVVGIVVVAAGALAAFAFRAPAQPTGSLRIDSDPPGAEVQVDNTLRGMTPLSITLPEGSHSVLVRRGTNVKQLSVDISGNTAKEYHISWGAEPAAAAPATGSLSVVSDTPGSAVIVDGAARGDTPLTVTNLAPGRHQVLVRNSSASYQRTVDVQAGATASLVLGGAPAAAPSWGWVTVSTPFAVQVLESGRVIGTSEIERVMLSPGSHELEFVSTPFGFRQRSKVNVSAARGEAISLTIPRVPVNINAVPWAEVFVDGTSIGDTPLGNVMQPLGDHELVFRHPQLGEKRQVTRVTLTDSLRISVDMRSK